MRTYAKKKECANAPASPFTTFSHCAYGYNIRNELISAAKLVGGDDPGAPHPLVWTTPTAKIIRPNGWILRPNGLLGDWGDRWLHSDVKDMAYFYVFKFFERIKEEGELE